MKVSIITSCYNREATIRGAIESVLEQDYPYIEYIVVDGASKDNSLAVINEYKNGIDTIISEPDKGMYEAINKGIRAATGDIIGLIHSDDFLFSSHTISEIVKTFEEQDADMIYGNGVFVDYDDTNQMIRNWISGRYSKENVKNGWLPLHPTVYIKKECMDKWGLYDESYKIAADSDLLVRYLYEADLKVYYLNKYIVKMRISSASGISLHGSLASMNCGIFERILPFSAEMGFIPWLLYILKSSAHFCLLFPASVESPPILIFTMYLFR